MNRSWPLNGVLFLGDIYRVGRQHGFIIRERPELRIKRHLTFLLEVTNILKVTSPVWASVAQQCSKWHYWLLRSFWLSRGYLDKTIDKKSERIIIIKNNSKLQDASLGKWVYCLKTLLRRPLSHWRHSVHVTGVWIARLPHCCLLRAD